MSDSELLSPGEAAARLGVTVKTLRRWADDGLLAKVRTLGGHNRYRTTDVDRILADGQPTEQAS